MIVQESWEYRYLALINDILKNGDDRIDRTGVGTRAVFGRHLDIDLTKGFPAVTTKKLAFRAVLSELLWFLEGSSDERRLAEILHGTRDGSKTTIWTENANAPYWLPKARYKGDLGRVYGVQWRDWRKYELYDEGKNEMPDTYVLARSIDQVQELIVKLRTNPTDRRMIISAWNPAELSEMALPPCHMIAQFFVRNGKLSCMLDQRSVDVMLGLPFNIASYALLTHILARVSGLEVDRLIMTLGDTHIYSNHLEGAILQIERSPKEVPWLSIRAKEQGINDFAMNDFALEEYEFEPSIKLPMAV